MVGDKKEAAQSRLAPAAPPLAAAEGVTVDTMIVGNDEIAYVSGILRVSIPWQRDSVFQGRTEKPWSSRTRQNEYHIAIYTRQNLNVI